MPFTLFMEQTEIMAAFGQRVRSLRLERGLSQERIAELSGLDRTYVSQVETGRRNATLTTVYKFADALEVHPSVLLTKSGEE